MFHGSLESLLYYSLLGLAPAGMTNRAQECAVAVVGHTSSQLRSAPSREEQEEQAATGQPNFQAGGPPTIRASGAGCYPTA